MADFKNIIAARKMQIAKNLFDNVLDMQEAMIERIFVKLKDVNGNSPKPYSTEPITVSKKNYKNIKLGGIVSKTKKTHHFEGGYSQLKSESGRPPLELFGRLKSSFKNGLREVNEFEFEIAIPLEDSYKIQKHFPNFFKASKLEKEILLKNL